MNKILSLLLLTFTVGAMDRVALDRGSVHVPGRLGNVEIYRTNDGYHVEQNGQIHEVPNHRVSPLLKKFGPNTINRFLENGYITVNQSEDGQYSLDGNVRINGGGPLLAAWVYSLTRGTLYGVIIGTATASVAAPIVATLPVAGPTVIATTVASAKLAVAVGGTAGVASTGLSACLTAAFGSKIALALGGLASSGAGAYIVAGVETVSGLAAAGAALLPGP